MIVLNENVNLSGSSLIIPSVAVGNVGQLVTDLVISNGELQRIGHILTSCFIPIIGANPYTNNPVELCTSCDIYHNAQKKLAAIQIRSPVIHSLNKFFSELKELIADQKIAKIIILTSGWAHIRNDAQIQSEPMRYVASSRMKAEIQKQIVNSNLIELEVSKNANDGSECRRIPGGGFAIELFEFLNQCEIPAAVLLKFCSEGDNVPDAVELLHYLCKWISLDVAHVKVPNSWKFLFGTPAPSALY